MRWQLAGLALLCAVSAAACQTTARAGKLATAAVAPALADTEARIFERQQIMTQLDEDTETLGDILSGSQPAAKLAATTRAIAKSAVEARASFQTTLPGGRSKPEVWSNHADFMQRMDGFVRETEVMAKLGEAGNLAGVTDRMIAALPCKQCHDIYREPKKPKPQAQAGV